MVQLDYAPDYKNYTSDVTRVFPANGKFTPRQREFYGIYLKLYQALMTSIKVHKRPATSEGAVVKMDAIMGTYNSQTTRSKRPPPNFVENYRKQPRRTAWATRSEWKSMTFAYPTPTLEPGDVFTIEPAMQIEDEHLGIRLEDMLLITESGYENLSAFVPVEIADIEKLMARGHGLSETHSRLKSGASKEAVK